MKNKKSDYILKRAREVLKIEAEAVFSQLSHVGPHWVSIVNAIDQTTKRGGKIVVMGIGKSGIIGRKISATFSSTGTPAIFFHPSEALHGDLGMIQKNDIILALSASGETEEIKKILPVLKQKKMVLISITGNPQSELARLSNYVINSAVSNEACPLNLAPTASTTSMLALGDALAMCLMELKKFKPTDFALLHPGGSLGKKLTLTVKDVMHTGKQNPIVYCDSSVREALLEMTRTRLGATHVVDRKGILKGFFTDGDLRRKLQQDPQLLEYSMTQVMTSKPRTITLDKTLHEALILIRNYGVDNIPVVDSKGKPIGILDERDLL